MPDPLVSIIIPTWNRSELLKRTIKSILNQTYSNYEILVCDDGSTDGTKRVVDEFKDNRIKYFLNIRAGRPAVPRNNGIKHASGEWIAFLDSDDEWLPDKLQNQMELLLNSGYHAICSNAIKINETSKEENLFFTDMPEIITFQDLLTDNIIICSSVIIHRSIISKGIGFPEDPDLKAIEDYAFWLRIAVFTHFVSAKKPTLRYYDNNNASIRSTVKKNRYSQRYSVLKNLLNWYETVPGVIFPYSIWKIKIMLMTNHLLKIVTDKI